jgi:hypothetical protein
MRELTVRAGLAELFRVPFNDGGLGVQPLRGVQPADSKPLAAGSKLSSESAEGSRLWHLFSEPTTLGLSVIQFPSVQLLLFFALFFAAIPGSMIPVTGDRQKCVRLATDQALAHNFSSIIEGLGK